MAKKQNRDWTGVREWINVAVAVSALLVAVVSFWTTTRISGLEDYLKAEVTRRNSELNGLSARSEQALRNADDSQRQLTHLQSSTTAAVTESITAQRRLFDATVQLNTVRDQVLTAQIQLQGAKTGSQKLAADFAQQTSRFDLFQRRQVYQVFAFTIITNAYLSDGYPDGKGMTAAIKAMAPSPDQIITTPYFERVHTRIESVCPDLPVTSLEIPAKPAPPPQPTISYMSNASQAEIARLTTDALAKWNADYTLYETAMKKWQDIVSAERRKLISKANACVCASLADEKFGKNEICPSEERRDEPLS
jgi:hypothetical protein